MDVYAILNELRELRKEVAALTDLLRRLPEIQAAVFFQFEEEKNEAAMQGRKPRDTWVIAPPEKR